MTATSRNVFSTMGHAKWMINRLHVPGAFVEHANPLDTKLFSVVNVMASTICICQSTFICFDLFLWVSADVSKVFVIFRHVSIIVSFSYMLCGFGLMLCFLWQLHLFMLHLIVGIHV